MTNVLGLPPEGAGQAPDGNRKQIISRANLGRWFFLGTLLSVTAGLLAYTLMTSTGTSMADAVIAGSGAAATVATLYVTVSAFVNTLPRH
jgi:tetrahydromethanopterin S-methyltransferase subunit E